MGLYDTIYKIIEENNEISNISLYKTFPDINRKTIMNRAREVRLNLGIEKPYDPKIKTPDDKKIITLQLLEPIIYKKIMHNPTNQDLKLAVDIIKIKAMEQGMQDDIDIDKFVKKALTKLQSQEEDKKVDDDLEEVMKEETIYLKHLLGAEDTNIEDDDDYDPNTGDYY